MVRHQATNPNCLQVQSDAREAEKLKTESKPSASPRAQRASKRGGNLDDDDEGSPCKKEKLMDEVMLQKLAMKSGGEEEDVQEFWEQCSEENAELADGVSMGSQQKSRGASKKPILPKKYNLL